MGRRRLDGRAELVAQLEWLRYAIHDRHVDVRLVLEGLLDAIEALAGPVPPRTPPAEADAAGPPAGVVLQ